MTDRIRIVVRTQQHEARNDGKKLSCNFTLIVRRANHRMPLLDPLVQPFLQKYSVFPNAQINLWPSRATKGRFAIVTDAARDAVDADRAQDEGAGSGRRSRVVLTPRRRRQVLE